jgi:hypothetical protein
MLDLSSNFKYFGLPIGCRLNNFVSVALLSSLHLQTGACGTPETSSCVLRRHVTVINRVNIMTHVTASYERVIKPI